MTDPARQGRIRVLQTIGTMHIGGAENVVVELARGLDRRRFDVQVCCTKERGVLAEQLVSDGVDVVLSAPPSHALRHATPLYLLEAIRRFQPDVVHTHGAPSLLHVAPLALMGLTPRWVHTFHYGRYDSAQGRQFDLEQRVCGLASDLVAVSDAQRRSIERRFALPAGRIVTITNGVRYTPPPADELARQRSALGLAPHHVVIGSIAVLSEQKGIPYLLRAAQALAPRHHDLRLLLVGGGPMEDTFRAEARSLGLGDLAIFTGWRTEASRLLPLFDVWVMSSLWEAMPMALIEAMAAARAIVATDVGDNRNITAGSALIVPPASSEAIEQAVERFLFHPGDRTLFGASAAEVFAAHYTTEQMVSSYEALFEARSGWRPAITRS